MAKQNEVEVNTDKSVRQLDKLEKKLSRVDSLFERAQRRGSALGKMAIAPTLALNDKLSDHLTRIENRLQGLNRTTISPSLHIADKATAEIAGVSAYLKTVTETKWMINFEAISWGKLFSGSFSDWLKGQNLMTSIAEELNKPELFQESGTLAGEQFFQSFLDAIDPEQIAEKFKELELNANININGGSDSGSGDLLSKTGDFFLDILKDTISGTISGIITNKATKFFDDRKERKKKLKENSAGQGNKVEKEKKKKSNSEQKDRKKKAEGGNKKDKQKSNDHIDNKNKKTPATKSEKFSFSKSVDNLKETQVWKWGEKNLNKFDDFLSEKRGDAKKFIKGDSSWKPVPDLTKGFDYKGDKFKPISNSFHIPNSKLIKGFGAASLIMDAASIITADSGRERAQAIGSSILSSVGSILGGLGAGSFTAGTGILLGASAGGVAGGYLGDEIGGWIYDLFYGKDDYVNTVGAVMTSPVLASLYPRNKGVIGLPLKTSNENKPSPTGNIGIPGIGSSTRVPTVPFGFVPTPPTPITPTATMQAQPEVQKQILDPTIQVNLPVGAVQLTVNQPELNYDQIASVVGTKITSSVQLAWQNTKLR
jgi:hypothetical protein